MLDEPRIEGSAPPQRDVTSAAARGRDAARRRIVSFAMRRRPAVAPILIYLAGQALAVGMLAALCAARGWSLAERLIAWDGRQFLRIAARGYEFTVAGNTNAYTMLPGSPVFLPGYPGLIVAVHTVTRLPLAAAALVISWICGVLFACAIMRLVRHVPGMGRNAGLIAVALIAVSPISIVFAMAYSEALFCALAAWALVHALRGRWGWAGLLAFAAGCVHISSVAIAAAFGVTALAAALRHRQSVHAAVMAALRPAAAALAAVAGTIAWIVGSGLAMGSATAWFTAQEDGWNSHWDFGFETAGFVYHEVTRVTSVFLIATVAVLIAAIVLVVVSIRQHQPLLLVVYGVAVVVEVVGSAGIMNSKIRLLIPAFTILLPVAAWLARMRRAAALWTIAAVAVAGTWFSAYALTIWPHAI